MKPQIITELKSLHSENKGTGARLIKGGSWKKQRVIVIIPTGDMIPAKVALSHWNMAFPPNNGVFKMLAQGMEVGDAYSSAVEQILSHPELSKWEYILTIEHDNIPQFDSLIKLLASMEENKQFSAIGGLYFTKGEGGCAQIWGDITDPIPNFRPQVPVPGKLVECYGTGMGFTLFRLKMFKDSRLPKPFFKTVINGSQDLVSWGEFRKYGYRCAVDCSVTIGHYDVDNDIVW